MRRWSLIAATICLIVAPVVPVKSTPKPTSSVSSFSIIERPVSTGFVRGRTKPVDTIVIHSVFAKGQKDPYSVSAVLETFAAYAVSAHYLIARDGTVYRLVAESDTSFHAGESKMPRPDGRLGVNDFSIGIELIGGHRASFTEAQYQSLETLVRDIRTRHSIKAIVGHGDIASGRRTDPWNFDWNRVERWVEH